MDKTRLDDLAILGGACLFDERLHVGRPNIGNRQRFCERLDDILDRRWLTNCGAYVAQLEAAIAHLLGVAHVVATCNATLGLQITAQALGLSGEVIVPSFTFVATAHALRWLQITPVFCDIDPATHNIDPRAVERLITPRTTGIVAVHLWGRPCDTAALEDIARRHGLRLVYDAAHAFACSHRGRMLGNFGDAEVFSFQATKFFNTLEGGAVATNSAELAARLRMMKNFGFAGYDEVACLGINAKMTEVSAAMGLTGLEDLDQVIEVNASNYHDYLVGLEGVPGVRVMRYDESEQCNYQYVVLEIDEAVAGVSRDVLQRVLWAENVLARRYFYPGCHRLEPYRSCDDYAGLSLPVTEAVAARVLSLPTGTAVGSDEVREICQLIRLAVERAQELKARLSDWQPAAPLAPGPARAVPLAQPVDLREMARA